MAPEAWQNILELCRTDVRSLADVLVIQQMSGIADRMLTPTIIQMRIQMKKHK